MPIAAPMIAPGEIPVRNEIAREWRTFTANVAENRMEDAWAGLSARLRKGLFESDPERFRAWVAREQDGLLKGLGGSWLYQLRLSTVSARAKPEGMDALREVRFVKERGRWRIDNWGVVPTS